MRLPSPGSALERTLHPTQVLVLSFGSAIFVGTLLLQTRWAASGTPLTWIDALFTATSATCVTGLIVVDTGKDLSLFGQWVVLGLIQLGGLGIMTFSSVFLLVLRRRLSFRGQSMVRETLGHKERSSVHRLIRDVFLFTFTIELAGGLLLLVVFLRNHTAPVALFSAVFHSISAFCNAGFSLYSTSFMDYRGDWILNITVMILIVAGGLGFTVLEDLADAWSDRRAGRAVKLTLHTKVVLSFTGALIAGGAVLIWVFEFRNALEGVGFSETVLACLFQSVTARTAGFNTLDYSMLTNTTLFISILLMFIGACPGSCGGGIKVSTFAVVSAVFRDRLLAHSRVQLFRRTMPEETVSRSVALLIASFAFVTVMTFLVLGTEIGPVPHHHGGGRFLDLFFEVVSAFGTVGLSTGATATLSSAGKLLIIGSMFVGRLGPLTLALAVGKKATRGRFQYAEENLMVG